MNKSLISVALIGVALVSFAAGVLAPKFFSDAEPSSASAEGSNGNSEEREPLYWVAPMDASYKRDQPGKSPMGMDLVPVYAEDQASVPGDVRIQPAVQQNLGLTLGEATLGEFSVPVETVAYVEVNQDTVQHFHVRATGWISELSVAAEGDPVKAGQKLFEFYSPEIINIQREYLQGLESGRSAQANSSLSQLRAKGVSEREIERLKETRQVREKLHYYANRDGFVVNLGVREGNFVDLPQNLMSIGSLEDIWVIAEVFEQQASLITQGQPVTLTSDAFPGREWRAQVDYIYPVLNADNRTLRLRLKLPNQDMALQPQMYLRARVDTRQRDQILTVPRSAVIYTGAGARVVRQIEPEVFRSVKVETGLSNGARIEILAGLEPGDRVVTNAQFLIDSESSIDAELDRIETRADEGGGDESQPAEGRQPQWVDSVVKSIDAEDGNLNVYHDPVPAWDWPAMAMGFSAGKELNLEQLPIEQPVELLLAPATGGGFEVRAWRPTDDEPDHSDMGHSEMDHSEVDHSDHNGGQP